MFSLSKCLYVLFIGLGLSLLIFGLYMFAMDNHSERNQSQSISEQQIDDLMEKFGFDDKESEREKINVYNTMKGDVGYSVRIEYQPLHDLIQGLVKKSMNIFANGAIFYMRFVASLM